MSEPPASRVRRFLSELKRRRVYRAAVAYLGVGFVVVEAADVMVPALLLPEWVTRVVVVLVILGFPVTLALSWALDFGRGGLRRVAARSEAADRAAPELSPADGELPTGRPGSRGGAPDPRRAVAYLAAGIVLAGVAFGAYGIVRPAWVDGAIETDEVESLAVLPFADMSPGGDQRYLSHGIAEEIRGALGKLEGLRMAARGASFSFPETGVDPRVVGDSLGVDAVLEGSVRTSGEAVKISAELVETEDAFSLWAGTYEGHLENLFAVQEEIARAIVGALQVEMGSEGGAGGEEGRLVARRTEDPEAYRLYLKGRHAWSRRTGEGMESAVRFFTAAVERDPGLAAAHVGLADARAMLVAYGFRPGAELDRARRDVRRALELEPEMVEAHASLGWIRTARWEWEEAETAFRRALELDPEHPAAHQWYAWNLANRGRTAEAVRSVRRALRLDSLSLIVNADLGIMLYHDGRVEEAVAQLRRTLRRDPGFAVAHEWLGLARLALGRPRPAVKSLERALELSPARSYQTVASLGLAHGRAGDTTAARAILNELERRARDEPISPAAAALVWMGLERTDRTLALLDRASAERDPFLGTYLVPLSSPILAPLRDEPGFRRVLARMGLSPRASAAAPRAEPAAGGPAP